MIKKKDNVIRDYYIIAAAVAVYAVVQLILVSQMNGFYIGGGGGDEYSYYTIAYDLFYGNGINELLYPIMYPLVIMVSFFFEDPYSVMKIINIALNAAIPFISYAFIKDMVSRDKAVLISIALLFCNFSMAYPSFIMGENLIYLLFVVAFFYHIRFAKKKNLLFAFGAGVLIAIMYLTKYTALLLLPAFGLYWIIQYFDKNDVKKSLTEILKQFVVYGLGYAFIFIGYSLIYANINSLSLSIDLFKSVAGFYVSSGPETNGYTFTVEFKWVVVYGLYALVLLLPGVIAAVGNWKAKFKERTFINKFVFLTILTVIFMVYIAARHSTHIHYNHSGEVMLKLLGRYVGFASFSGLVLAVLMFDKESKPIRKLHALYIGLAASAALTLSYFILYEKLIWQNEDGWLNTTRGSALGGYEIFGIAFLIFNIVLIGLFVYFMFVKRNQIIAWIILLLMVVPSSLVSTYDIVYSNFNQKNAQVENISISAQMTETTSFDIMI